MYTHTETGVDKDEQEIKKLKKEISKLKHSNIEKGDMLAKVHIQEMYELKQKNKALEQKLVTAEHIISKQKAKLDKNIDDIKPRNLFKFDRCDTSFESENSLNGHVNRKHGGNYMKLTTLIGNPSPHLAKQQIENK